MAIEKTPNVPPFVSYCAQLIPTVFDNSLSYYEALAALAKWMQDNLVDVINNNATVTEQYIRMTEELKAYVENYFDNLDVQEEINNKLDAMVEDGTLQEIITQYIQANVAWTFDTVADMKSSTNLIAGSYAQTLGFHSLNDGGGSLYYISNTGTANEMDVISIDSLYANLVLKNELNVKQLGAYGNGTNDDYQYINRALTLSDNVYLPSGNYLLDSELYLDSHKHLYGDNELSVLVAGDIDHIIHIIDKEDITLNNLKLDGKAEEKEDASELTSAIYGIDINGSKNIVIKDMIFTNLGYLTNNTEGTGGGNMISIAVSEDTVDGMDCDNILIEGCKFIDPEARSSFGVRLWTQWGLSEERKYFVKNVKISKCFFTGNCYNNIEIAGNGTIYNIVEDCYVKDSNAIACIEADKGASYNKFINNTIDGVDCKASQSVIALNCAYDGATDYPIGNTFINNTVRNVKANTTSTCSVLHLIMDIDTIVSGLTIENLIPKDSSTNGNGIYLDASKNTIIEDCNLNNLSQSLGIRVLNTCENVTINNCIIKGARIGCQTFGTTDLPLNLNFTNNTVINSTSYGFSLAGVKSNIIICNNIFDTCTRGIQFVNGAKATVVSNYITNVSDTNKFGIDARGANNVAICRANTMDGCTIAFDYDNFNNRVYNNDRINVSSTRTKAVTYASSYPTAGEWAIGDIVYNQTPTAGGNIGWVCTTAGTPGTWKAFGSIAS